MPSRTNKAERATLTEHPEEEHMPVVVEHPEEVVVEEEARCVEDVVVDEEPDALALSCYIIHAFYFVLLLLYASLYPSSIFQRSW